MSEFEERRGPRLYLTEIRSLLQLIKGGIGLVVGLVGFGFCVLIFVEPYFLVTDAPKPGWVEGLENVYSAIWRVTKTMVGAALSAGPTPTAQINPNCTVQFVRFEDKGESGRWTFGVSQLDVLPQQATAKGVTWQNVQVKSGEARGSIGWVTVADLNATLAKPECR